MQITLGGSPREKLEQIIAASILDTKTEDYIRSVIGDNDKLSKKTSELQAIVDANAINHEKDLEARMALYREWASGSTKEKAIKCLTNAGFFLGGMAVMALITVIILIIKMI